MKNFKKIASAIAALSLAACVAVPMSATVFTASAEGGTSSTVAKGTEKYTLKITDEATDKKYEAYQIFSGDLEEIKPDGEGDVSYGVLSNIVWGNGVDTESKKPDEEGKTLSEALAATTIFKDADTAQKVADALKNEAAAKEFASIVAPYLTNKKPLTATADGYQVENLTPGYYLVQNEAESLDEKDDAYTSYILQVVGNVTTNPKKASPTVDKQVQDETTEAEAGADDEGFGETADHGINEKFKFKLKAKLPDKAEMEDYKAYKLVFHDSWSAGVSYDGGIALKVGTETIELSGNFEESGSDVAKGVSWTVNTVSKTLDITINDVVALMDTQNLRNLDVEVTYDAHLNENAIVSDTSIASSAYKDTSTDKINNNSVYLEYSNNPNQTGEGNPGTDTGKTTEDTVGVFTYKIDNTKIDGATKDSEAVTKLSGAVFELYAQDPFNVTSSNPALDLVEISGKGYRLKVDGDSSSVTTVTSDGEGKFTFYGLDAGTYYLKEVTAPTGYNLLDKAIPVTITATHKENTDADVKLDLSKSTYNGTTGTLSGQIENNKGATLPSTGGIGTTLFYLGGGALVAVAGVMLITKKRMTKE